MKKTKRVLSILLAVIMVAVSLPVAFSADVIASGSCGENVTYTLDSEGTLTLSGTGATYDYPREVATHNDPDRLPLETLPEDSPFSFFNEVNGVFITNLIKKIIINEGITSIGSELFWYCHDVSTIVFSSTVTSIGAHAFAGCGLTNITIPAGITNIGAGAFEDSALTKFSVESGNTSFSADSTGCLYNKNKTVLVQYPSGNTRTSFSIPSTVTQIYGSAFYGSANLTSISIPSSVTSIGNAAFAYCSGLTAVTVPSSVQTMGSGVFHNCSALKTATIKSGITTLSDYTFSSCENLTSFTIPSSVTSIGAGAFGNSGLTSMTIPSGVTSIGYEAFSSCSALATVSIPSTVTEIHGYSFEDCISLENVSMSEGMTYIGVSMFEGCNSLTSITIPSGVMSIGQSAFEDCNQLTSVTIPASVASIDNYAFDGCNSLTRVNITDLASWCNILFEDDESNPLYEGKGSLYLNGTKLQNVQIPDGIQKIKQYAFVGSLLEKVSIPEGVTRIDYSAFEDCNQLTSVTIPVSMTSINFSAFENCNSLTDIYYAGSESQWNNIEIHPYGNDRLTTATKHFSGQEPSSQHTVTYNYSTNGGSSATQTTATVAEGSAISLSPTATKSGWTFVGWNTNANATTALSSLNMGTSNVTLYAIFKKTLTGTFIDYSGTTKKTTTKTVDIYNNATSGTVSAPTQNTYTGWTSRGWATGTAADASTVSSYTISANTTYYGLYQRTLTLSYNANGGSSTPSSQNGTQYTNSYSISATKDPSFTLASAPTKSGYTFDGWAMGSASGTKYAAGANVTISANTTMYATWTVNPPTTHTVTYNYSTNGGTSATQTTATVAEGSAIDLTPTATKSGWTFVGWNTNSNATTALSSLNMGSSNVTLYAIFKKTLTGTFIDYSGSTKKTTTKTVDIFNKATSGTLTAPAQNTYSGWTSRGWATATSADASAVSSYSISANTTYYGLYQRTLTLSYNANGGSSTPSSQNGTQYTNSYSISSTKNPTLKLANAISKSGSTFDGWAMGSASGTKYAAGSNVTISANTTMFATWKAEWWIADSETYSFANSRSSFKTQTREVSDADFTKLANYVKKYCSASDAAVIINNLQSVREGEWGGSCYGMAVTAILDKYGQIDFNKNFDPDAQTMWQVDVPYKNKKVLSAINYYLIAQIIPFIRQTEYKKAEASWKAGIKKLVQNAQAGKLMMFGFGGTWGGHEIVIKGYQQNSDGSYKLITWDNNFPGEDESIYVKSDFSDLWIYNPDNGGKRYGDITRFHFFTDFSMFDYRLEFALVSNVSMKTIERLCALQPHGRLTLPPLAPD